MHGYIPDRRKAIDWKKRNTKRYIRKQRNGQRQRHEQRWNKMFFWKLISTAELQMQFLCKKEEMRIKAFSDIHANKQCQAHLDIQTDTLTGRQTDRHRQTNDRRQASV